MSIDLKKMIKDAWTFLASDKRSLVGLAIIIILTILAIFANYISSYRPGQLFQLFQRPTIKHPMGTDQIGRDIFTMALYGIRVSLLFGFGSAAVALLVGLTLGAIAGYYGGLVDNILSRVFEIFMMIPSLFLIILAVALFGTNIYTAMVCVGLTIWPANAKIMRAQVLSLKNREFVKSATLIGANDFRILTRHILPNGIQPVIANTTMLIGSAILTEAALSFLGLGDINNPSWGQIIHYSQYYVWAWWMALFPGLLIIITVFAFNLLGDGLSISLNPKLRSSIIKPLLPIIPSSRDRKQLNT